MGSTNWFVQSCLLEDLHDGYDRMEALKYGVSWCCNYEMAVWRSCMERRWDSSEPSGRSRGKVVRKIKKKSCFWKEFRIRQVGS